MRMEGPAGCVAWDIGESSEETRVWDRAVGVVTTVGRLRSLQKFTAIIDTNV